MTPPPLVHQPGQFASRIAAALLGVALTGAAVVLPIAAPAAEAVTAPTVTQPAPLPPLGWNSWNTYGCNINETKIKAAADTMVSSGMKAAGYQYVIVDDCWQALTRDANGNLQADPNKFPSGMKALGDYIHSKGLKFGIYQAPLTKTCAELYDPTMQSGSTGALGHETQDANLFASWGVDYLKYDWCDSSGDLNYQIQQFKIMRKALQATGRPIVYSINPNSAHDNTGPSYNWGQIADMWRTTEDISPAWTTSCTGDCAMGVTNILDVQAGLTSWTGPGHYNDPDMLEVGNVSSWDSVPNQAHFGMWAMMGAPLIAGNDLTTMSASTAAILTNSDLLAIDQDSLALQATRVRDDGDNEVWSKRLADGSYAVALLNRNESQPTRISTTAAQIGLGSASSYSLTDVWSKTTRSTTGTIQASVPPRGATILRVKAGTVTATQFALQGTQSSRCIDVLGGAAGYNTQAVIWDCQRTYAQLFSRVGATLVTGGMCLDVDHANTADGTAVITWACNGQTNQSWTLQSDGTITTGLASNKCLSLPDGQTGNNQTLTIRTCAGQASQKWTKVSP